MCGLGRSPNNSLMVACGDAVVVVAMRNDAAASDVAATNDVVVVVGDTDAVVIWVQQCLIRPCKNPQFHFVSVVVTLMGKELSWWYRQTIQGPHSTTEVLVSCQP